MPEYLFSRNNNTFIEVKNRDNADYQCFFTFRRKVLSFQANYKVKLTNSYKEVKKDSLLWKQLLKEVCKVSFS